MNITFLPNSYLPNLGGVEVMVNKLAKVLIAKGHNVNIITSKFPINLKSHEIIDGVAVDRLYFPYLPLLKANFIRIICLIFSIPFTVLKLWKLIKKNRTHIINLHYTGLNAYYTLFLSYLCKFRLIITLHGFSVQILPFLPKKESWVFNKILRRADYVTSCSRALLDDAHKRVPEIKNKSTVILNGVDQEDFRVKYNYICPHPYIFSLGRFSNSQKGFDILIMAFRTVVDKGYDVNLIIAGSGPQKEYYESLVNLLRLHNKVKFFGKVDRGNVARLFSGCEFFVLPSRIEPFGIVNLEAMAAGKAIVATRTGGVPEIVKDGVNGILVEPCNDKALAEGMIRLLNDGELKERLGRNGRKMVEDPKFSWDNIADEYVKAYGEVLQEK